MDLTTSRQRRPRRWIQHALLLVGGVLVVAETARAHPTGDRLPAQLLEVEIQPTGLVISLEAEAPLELLQLSAGTKVGAPELILDRLDHGLYAEVDGHRVGLTRRDRSVSTDLVSGHGFVLRAVWEAAVTLDGHHTVRVGNANLGDGPSWFRDEVRLWPGTRLHSTNLHRVLRGEAVNYEGRWLRAESLRRVDLDLTMPTGPLDRAYAWMDPRPWSLRDAGPTGWAWRDGRENAGTVALALGIASLLGALAAACAPGRWGWWLLAPVWLVVGVAIPPAAASTGLAAAALIPLLHPGEARWAVPFAGLAAASLFATPWTLWGLAAWGLGLLLGHAVVVRPGLAASGLAVLAVLVALRG